MLGFQDKSRDENAEVAALITLAESKGRSASETAGFATTAVLSFTLPAPSGLPAGLASPHPAEVTGTDKDLLASLSKHLKTNGPLLEVLLKKRADQVKAIDKVEALALSASPFVNRTGGVRFLGAAAKTLKLLYDADVLSEEAVIAWGQAKGAAANLDPDLDVRFLEKVKPFIDWLEEDSESEEESDEE